MFEGFTHARIDTSGARINLRHGGSGPPLLLLHGNPLTHVCGTRSRRGWRSISRVVASDLRGYGDSSKPDGGKDHIGYSFRAMAQDQVEAWAALGLIHFLSVADDRGGRVAPHGAGSSAAGEQSRVPRHRAHPSHAEQHQEGMGGRFLPLVFHGAALRLPRADADCLRPRALHPEEARQEGRRHERVHPEALAEYIRCTPENIHAVCEDYRAAVGIDLIHDEADLGTKLSIPVLVLWGERSHVNRSYRPIEAWLERAVDVRGKMLPCGHYPAEQVPDETYAELRAFFGSSD
jgi:haloacetate dehalogenase